MSGASLCMPDRWLQAEPLVPVHAARARRPSPARCRRSGTTCSATSTAHEDAAWTRLRLILCGGSAVPVSLQKALQERHGLLVLQAWGMTETSPVASAGRPPVGVDGEDASGPTAAARAGCCLRRGGPDRGRRRQRAAVGRQGRRRARGARSLGDRRLLQVRRPRRRPKFHDGWLRTGDVGTIDELGYIRLSDRAKDVIKSGGEWISSVDLENALMAHHDVVEAAVIGIPDEKWEERPLASVVVREGATLTPGRAARVPEQGLRQVAAARRVGLHRRRCRARASASSTRR